MASKPRKGEKKDDNATPGSPDMAALAKMLTEHKTSLSTEFSSAFAKLEAKLDAIQTAITDHHQRISSLESHADTTSETLQALETKIAILTEDNAKLRAKTTDLESRSRRNNIRIIGLPENIEGPRATTFFSQLLVEVFGEQTLTSPPELDRAHRTLTARPGPGEKPRAVLLCFHKFQTRELVVRESRRLRGKLEYKGKPIHIFEDYSPEILEQRSVYRDVMKELYNLGCKPALHYPARLFITTERGEKKRILSVQEARQFITSQRQRGAAHTED